MGLTIPNTKQINCPVLKLDRLEAGLERIEEKTLISLLNLYNEKLTIRLEAYDDSI